MERLKAGYVSFGTQYYKPDALRAISERAEKQLRDAGIDLARTDPVTGEGPEPERAIRDRASVPGGADVRTARRLAKGQSARTSFPRTWPASLSFCASAASASGKMRCTFGFSFPLSHSSARVVSCDALGSTKT